MNAGERMRWREFRLSDEGRAMDEALEAAQLPCLLELAASPAVDDPGGTATPGPARLPPALAIPDGGSAFALAGPWVLLGTSLTLSEALAAVEAWRELRDRPRWDDDSVLLVERLLPLLARLLRDIARFEP